MTLRELGKCVAGRRGEAEPRCVVAEYSTRGGARGHRARNSAARRYVGVVAKVVRDSLERPGAAQSAGRALEKVFGLEDGLVIARGVLDVKGENLIYPDAGAHEGPRRAQNGRGAQQVR